ncbi:MAG: hypothetical protein GY801_47815 [bacterium]|nr:hypothetical protein [bacterium]
MESSVVELIKFIVMLVVGAFLLFTARSPKIKRVWQGTLAFFGGILIIIGIVLALWPSPPKISSCNAYGVKITSHNDEQKIDPANDGSLEGGFRGTFLKEIPEGWKLWLFSAHEKENYRPKNAIEILPDKTWKTTQTVWVGGDPETVDFAVFLLGKNGQALLQFHDDALEYSEENTGEILWFPINTFTEDMHECAYLTIHNKGT